jgi:uncharacterized membrane protein
MPRLPEKQKNRADAWSFLVLFGLLMGLMGLTMAAELLELQPLFEGLLVLLGVVTDPLAVGTLQLDEIIL